MYFSVERECPQIIRKLKKNYFLIIHGQFTIIHVHKNYQCVWDERECPQIIRKLKKQLFPENSRQIHDNSRSQKLSMLQ